jgi:hypothetical protein
MPTVLDMVWGMLGLGGAACLSAAIGVSFISYKTYEVWIPPEDLGGVGKALRSIRRRGEIALIGVSETRGVTTF